MQTYDLSSITHTQYGTGGGSWHTPTDQSYSDDDRNRFYLGLGSWISSGSTDTWRSRIYFTIPSSLNITGQSKLVIKLIADIGWTPSRMRAFLSIKNTPNSNWAHIVGSNSTDADRLAMSYLYADADGKTRQISYMSATNDMTKACYLIFNYNFQSGVTYYIYLLPYDSDNASIDGCIFDNTWGRWRNLSNYTSVTLTYNSGSIWINTDGTNWQRALPWICVDGTNWKQCIPWICVDGTNWKQCGG